MNKVTSRRRHGGALAVVLAAAALLTAACGGGVSPVSAAQTAYQKAVAFSQCMRAHGVPGFPDPQSNGAILTSPQDRLAQGSPTFVAANKACQHLLPKIRPMTAAQQRRVTAQLLKLVACMRAHGIPNMADPVVNASGIEMAMPNGIKPNSPVFQSAQRACQRFRPTGLP
jgi:hypothetical protein